MIQRKLICFFKQWISGRVCSSYSFYPASSCEPLGRVWSCSHLQWLLVVVFGTHRFLNSAKHILHPEVECNCYVSQNVKYLKEKRQLQENSKHGKGVKRLLQTVMMKQLAGLLGVTQILIVYLEFEGAQQAVRYTILLTERKLTSPIPPPAKKKNPKPNQPKRKNYQKNTQSFLNKQLWIPKGHNCQPKPTNCSHYKTIGCFRLNAY